MRSNRWNEKCRKKEYALSIFLFCLAFFLFSHPVRADEDYSVTEVRMEGTVDTSSSLNIRSGPGTSYSVISKADKGASLVITGQTEAGGDTWYQVEIDGKTGFVLSDYVSASEAVPDGEEELEPEAGEPESGYRGFYQKPAFLKATAIVFVIFLVLVMIIFTLKGLKKDRETEEEDEEESYDDYEDGEESYDGGYDGDEGYEEDGEPGDDGYDGEPVDDDYEDEGYEDEESYDGGYGDGGYEDDGEPCDGDYEDEGYEDDGGSYDDGDGQDVKEYDINRRTDRSNDHRSRRSEGPKRKNGQKAYILREEDYRVQIDPRFFEDKEPIEQPAMVTGYLEQKLIEEAARAQEVEEKDEELHRAGGDLGDKQRELEQAMARLDELQKEIERLKSRK